MKKQVVIIHGGYSFNSRQEYIDSLKNTAITIDSFRPRVDWKNSLSDKLGAEYDVLLPRMPNKDDAHFAEWKTWFEKMFPFLWDEVILIGHSLGGIFLAKYLAENNFPEKISGLFLVAAPYTGVGDFILQKSSDRLIRQVSKIFLIASKDDQVVPFSEMESYKKELPNAEVVSFDDRGHFNQSEFPEIVTLIKHF
ncbi:MAG: alpha/beta fold hydrolase [Patescibacteria group bacterium]